MIPVLNILWTKFCKQLFRPFLLLPFLGFCQKAQFKYSWGIFISRASADGCKSCSVINNTIITINNNYNQQPKTHGLKKCMDLFYNGKVIYGFIFILAHKLVVSFGAGILSILYALF